MHSKHRMKNNFGNPNMHNTISTASNPGFQTSPKSSFDLAKNFKLPPLNFKPVLTDE